MPNQTKKRILEEFDEEFEAIWNKDTELRIKHFLAQSLDTLEADLKKELVERLEKLKEKLITDPVFGLDKIARVTLDEAIKEILKH